MEKYGYGVPKQVRPEREWQYDGDVSELFSSPFKNYGKPYDAADYGITQLGKNEVDGDDDRYIAWYNEFVKTNFAMNVGWCAIFASWCIGQTGSLVKSQKEVRNDFDRPAFSNSDMGLMTYIKMHRFVSGPSYVPQRGDILFLTNKTNREQKKMSMVSDMLYRPTHVAIVVAVNERENYVTTIEGNCSDKVKLINRYLINPNIVGYGY